jgi:uncharacterized protein (DUF983 family)
MTQSSAWTGISRGLQRRCPTCGKGPLFRGFLKVQEHCLVCGADNTIYPSDDMPPYVTIALVGHLVVPLFIWVDLGLVPPLWLEFAIWPLLTLVLCVGLLPFVKGGVIGLCWATGIVRPQPITAPIPAHVPHA